MPKPMWTPEHSFIAGALSTFLSEKGAFDKRHEVACYIDRCMAKGFCKTADDIRLCAGRYLDGKRAVTPPGTMRRKRLAKEQAAQRAQVSPELLKIVTEVVAKNEKAVTQFKAGNDKAVNALIGQVLRVHRIDAVIAKELLVEEIRKDV